MNTPVNMSDPSGNWPIWAIVAVVVVAAIVIPTVINHIVNAVNKEKIDSEIKNSYTIEEATKEINEILDDYSSDCNVNFDIPKNNGSYIVEIAESHKVNSRYDRQKISAIIENTSVTDREFDNISAEWLAHNLATPIPSLYQQAHSVGIDYDSDPRWYVVFPTKVLEILGWE